MKASGTKSLKGTSQVWVPDPYLSVLKRQNTVNAIEHSHPGRRRACTGVSCVELVNK